tara:strand:- start:75 stop:398 length:324 start_codon:yes stop_codon:yes gene_type:complete
MQHKGQALEKAVRESGIPLTKITKRMNKSRRWIYNAFENPNLGIDYIIEIGEIIHYDFSDVLVELKKFRATAVDKSDATDKEGSEYWKNKYLDLIEKYNEILERKLV